MKTAQSLRVILVTVALVTALAPSARAQGIEVGTSLVSLVVHTNSQTTTSFGVPSGVGFTYPGVYLSLFMGSRFAVEPQVTFIVTSSGGHTSHFLNLAGQADYFFWGADTSSPYVFGSVGFIDTGASVTPATVSGGVGYRRLVGERLAIRFDGRFTHFTKEIGNAFAFSVSLGGVFNRR